MKLRTYLIAAIACSLFFQSCEGPAGIPGRDGVDGKDGVGSIKTVLINVDQNKWEYSNQKDNNFFYATVDMPEITEDVFDMGLVKMYRTYDYDTKDAAQIELPYVRMNELTLSSGDRVFYTETVDYEFGIEYIKIFYTASDFDYEYDQSFVPEAMQFRCVILY